jgi:hypothetical protein
MDGFPVLDFYIQGFSSLQSYRFYNPPTVFEARWYYLKATLNHKNILAHNHLRPTFLSLVIHESSSFQIMLALASGLTLVFVVLTNHSCIHIFCSLKRLAWTRSFRFLILPCGCCAHKSLLYTNFLFIEKVGMNKRFPVPHTSLECGWYGNKLYTCLQLINIQVINTLQAQEAPYTY